MFGRKGIDELELRKRVLVLESGLNRLALQAQWREVRAATAWIGQAGHTWYQVKPWLVVLAPLAGVLAGRGSGRSSGIVSRLLTMLKWARILRGVWKDVAGAATAPTAQKAATP